MSRGWRQLLEETDWTGLSHAYGSAEDTPAHLRALLDGEAEARRAADDHLVSAIIHQGTPWPATYAATAIVLGMLRDAAIAARIAPSRDGMLVYLAEVEDALSQACEEDWSRLTEMAAEDNRTTGNADWTEIEDPEFVDALYARAMLGLRALLPEIAANLSSTRPRLALSSDEAR